jgi:hypothetical protein
MNEVKVPARVLEGLEAVLESGETNMFDMRAVQAIASRLKYHATVLWLQEKANRESYLQGIMRGFTAEDVNR